MLNCRAMNATTPDRETSPPRRVSLVLHPRRDVQVAIDQVTAWAQRTGTELARSRTAGCRRRSGAAQIDELAHGCDLVLALGGDGTMLGGLRLAAPLGVPVLGANLGRLGYLTEVDGEHLPEALEALGAGRLRASRSASCCAPPGSRTAQDASTSPSTTSSSAASRAAARPCWRCTSTASSWSATPATASSPPRLTGSTAYSYAAGGPIVSPQTRAMIITPDAPHGLFNRAVVLGDEESLGVDILPSSAPIAVEVDGRLLVEADPGWSVEITPNPWPALFVRLGSAGFAERARRKLGITDPAALANFDFAGHER